MKFVNAHQIIIIIILFDIIIWTNCTYTYTTRGFHYVNPKYQQQSQQHQQQQQQQQQKQQYQHQRPHYYQPYHKYSQKYQQQQMNNVGNKIPEVLVEWKRLLFNFPSQQERDTSLKAGTFIPDVSIPVDVQPYYTVNGTLRVFVTTPRFADGVPFTLSEVINENGENKLQAYPNYNWHNTGQLYDCDKITGVFRVAITACHQMWILDSGLAAEQFKCPPQLLLFDLMNDQLLHRYRFDTSVYTATASYFVTPLAVVNDPPPFGTCAKTMIYMADTNYHGLIMYNYADGKAWRAENKYMYPTPDYGTYTVAGQSFTLMDGIIGLAADQDNLYFHAMAGVNDLKVPLTILNNASIFENDIEAAEDAFQIINTRSSQCIPYVMDAKGFLYCITFNPIELVAWHPKTRETRKLPINEKHLEFVCGLKIIKNPQNVQELWILSNRFQRLATNTLDFNEVNFRILKLSLDA